MTHIQLESGDDRKPGAREVLAARALEQNALLVAAHDAAHRSRFHLLQVSDRRWRVIERKSTTIHRVVVAGAEQAELRGVYTYGFISKPLRYDKAGEALAVLRRGEQKPTDTP